MTELLVIGDRIVGGEGLGLDNPACDWRAA
jgi:hypothetical protein